MKIFIEGCAYEKRLVEGAIPDAKLLLTGGKVRIDHVGYYRSAGCDDFVFFLPKVLLEPVEKEKIPAKLQCASDGEVVDLAFCRWSDPQGVGGTQKDKGRLLSFIRPEDLVDFEPAPDGTYKTLTKEQVDFLYGFSVWIYRAIAQFDALNPDSDIIWKGESCQSGAFRRKYVTNTLLDVILALQRFHRDNQDYFRFKVQEKHSGCNKINWTRTIACSTAFVQDDVPIYFDLLNKKKVVDFDEELLVIFYSILNYIRSLYRFDIRMDVGYELITGARFDRYLNGYGERRLRQIKYKYFSDRDTILWELCFAFFSKAHKANVANEREEYLLAKEFEAVFENMIDVLLGDTRVARFKDLNDGKEIDHLYLDKSLIRRDEDTRNTLYIADSKYYKIGNALEPKSRAKQFTYAKDILQLNLNIFLFDDDHVNGQVKKARDELRDVRVGLSRDRMTESYDVIPNFFISASVEDGLSYEYSCPVSHPDTKDSNGRYLNIHFLNRLFDRDTLILSHYDVNFLYVLKLYAQHDESACAMWRDAARSTFRKDVRKVLLDYFKFSYLLPHRPDIVPAFFDESAKIVQGKIISTGLAVDGAPVFLMALEDPETEVMFNDRRMSQKGRDWRKDEIQKENARVVELIDEHFYRLDVARDKDPGFHLGEDPTEQLKSQKRAAPAPAKTSGAASTGVQIISHVKGPLTKAVDGCLWCPCPSCQCPCPDDVKVLVIPFTQGAHMYRVKGTEPKRNVAVSSLNGLTGGDFSAVEFPEARCHVWQVEKV